MAADRCISLFFVAAPLALTEQDKKGGLEHVNFRPCRTYKALHWLLLAVPEMLARLHGSKKFWPVLFNSFVAIFCRDQHH